MSAKDIPASEIRQYLKSAKPQMISFLERLVLLESPSHVPESQQGVLDILSEALIQVGYSVKRVAGRFSGGLLYARPARRKAGAAAQLLLGHCDTVWPLGSIRRMPLQVGNGIIKGPGVYDMKGGLAQIIFALKVLDSLGLTPGVTPVVLINSDEEVGSRDSKPYIDRLARRVDRALILEPAMEGSVGLKTSRKGVGRFTITVKGRAGHAGLGQEAGASAILELSFLIQKLFDLNDPEKGVTVNVGQIDGGLRPNVIAPESKAVVDVRVPNSDEARRVEQVIRGITPTTPGVRLEIEGRMGRPPLEETPRNQRLWSIAREAGERLGLKLEGGCAGGGSDGNWTSLHTATLDGLGPVGGGAHAHHEFVSQDGLVERTALLAMILLAPPLSSTAEGVAGDLDGDRAGHALRGDLWDDTSSLP